MDEHELDHSISVETIESPDFDRYNEDDDEYFG